jgi:hypothetical protein
MPPDLAPGDPTTSGPGNAGGGGDGGGGDKGQDVPEFTVNTEQLAALLGAAGGGGGSSSSGGGGSAGPADPTIGAAASFYFQLWGVKPPIGYIEGYIRQGHDLFDFMREQLARPGAAKQKFFRDQYAQFASLLARTFGRR